MMKKKSRFFLAVGAVLLLGLAPFVRAESVVTNAELDHPIKEKVYSGPVDGVFDREITEAVEEFQRQQGLEVDGVVGPKTMKKLGVY